MIHGDMSIRAIRNPAVTKKLGWSFPQVGQVDASFLMDDLQNLHSFVSGMGAL